MKIRSVVLLVLSGLLTGTASAETEFVGYMTSTEGPRFAIKDSDKVSGWLALGDSYAGYKVLAHDVARGVLTVEKAGARVDLPLKAPRVEAGATAERPKIGKITVKFNGPPIVPEKVVRDNMQLKAGDALDENSIDVAVRSLYRTGHFKSIEFKQEQPTAHTYDLVVIITPKDPSATPAPAPR